ncbi:MAG: diguanylate cyclase [Mesorhizobium sp.]|jgi:diguanylate cyclase (GGDEF)-like protein
MAEAKRRDGSAATGLAELASAVRHLGDYVDTLRERIRFLEAVVENFPGGLSLFDGNLDMVLCNERLKTLLDYPDDLFKAGNPSLEDLFRFNAARGEYGPGSPDELVARRMALVATRRSHVYERTRPDGTILEVRGAPVEGGGLITTYLDVTEQRHDQAAIAHMAHHDALTGLPNRALFGDRLATAIALAKRSGIVAVHYLDLDGFKPVNDRLGHAVGDALIKSVAARLAEAVRENDTVARLGGDEFAIVQTGIREETDAAILARRVLFTFGEPFVVEAARLSLKVSIGIALAPKDGSTSEEVLAKADAALYRSKAAGGGRFSFFDLG